MAGESGDFIYTTGARRDEDLKKRAKAAKKAVKAQKKRDRLAKAASGPAKPDSSIRPAVDGAVGDAAKESAGFHMQEADRHRRLARRRRSGHGVISLAHGESMARLHDATADWHEAQARGAGVV